MCWNSCAAVPADARRKIDAANEVLRQLSSAFDSRKGCGSGCARIQLLVDGTSSAFSILYHQTQVAPDGSIDTTSVLRNLRRRPNTEHRRLVNEGLNDLLERSLAAACEELPETMLNEVLGGFAGYQQRIGL